VRAKLLQSCLALCDPVDCSPPGFSVHWILQAGILGWVPCPPSGDLPEPGIEPASPALAGGFLTTSTIWEAPPFGILPTRIRGSERIIDVKQWPEPECSPVRMQEILLPEEVPQSIGRTESMSKREASVEMWLFSPAHYETGFYFSIPHIWTDYNLYWNRSRPDPKMPYLLPFVLLPHCCNHVDKPGRAGWLLPKNWNPAML